MEGVIEEWRGALASTLNQRVLGSSPSASTILFSDLDVIWRQRLPAGHQWGIRSKRLLLSTPYGGSIS